MLIGSRSSCVSRFLRSFSRLSLKLMIGLGRNLSQMLKRVDAAAVAVAPKNADGVIAHRLDAHHLERRRVHLERRELDRRRLRLGPVRASTDRARTVMTQVAQAVFARLPVFPIDLDAFRFGDRDMFG